MRRPKIIKAPDGTLLVERFSPIRRWEHVLAIVTFVTLVITGFPQKFHDAALSGWVISLLGGLEQTRWIHRIAGIVFASHAAAHIAAIVIGAATRRLRFSLLPTPQDLRDAWNNLRFYLGYRREPPPLPKFDYRQKFEYLGIILGGLVMVASGLILMYPALAASWATGEVIPAARVAHSNEALLALLVLVVWHIYGSHLSPEIFPMDRTIFTGYISAEELKERHALEYEAVFGDGGRLVEVDAAEPPAPAPATGEAISPCTAARDS